VFAVMPATWPTLRDIASISLDMKLLVHPQFNGWDVP
jgi:hypothetical protein